MHIYPISQVPGKAAWGERGSDGKDRSKLLCVGNEPVTVRLIGSIASKYFYDQSGNPTRRVTIGVRPLNPADLLAGNKFINMLSKPASESTPSCQCTGTHGTSLETNAPPRDILYASAFSTLAVRGMVQDRVSRNSVFFFINSPRTA